MGDASEPIAEWQPGKLVITVPRLPDRPTLRMCRARAKVIAARAGVRSEPAVVAYDDRPPARGGPPRHPQGWVFSFDVEG